MLFRSRARIAELAAPEAALNPAAEAASAGLEPVPTESASGEGDETPRTGTYHSHA